MSWRIQKNMVSGNPELEISGFEGGIADSPYQGIADIRNMNITTSPKQASVQFATAAMTFPPTTYTDISFSSDAATDIFTTASTTGFYNGMGLTIATVSGAGSGTAGLTYYVKNITATTFQLYIDMSTIGILDVTTNRTGTFTVYSMGTPADSVSAVSGGFSGVTGESRKSTFLLNSDGLAFYIPPSPGTYGNVVQFLGNIGHSSVDTIEYGIGVMKNYLFTFNALSIDYLPLATVIGSSQNPSALWIYGWKAINSTPTGHRCFLSPSDGGLYFCNGQYVGVIIEQEGQTFNPATAATYIYSPLALGLPAEDRATCLNQLGINLLIGGIQKYIYPWDKKSISYTAPLILAENYTACIVSMNSSAYIFAGNRGRIYITNGANIQEFKKFPDNLSGTVNPYYRWGWAIYWKDQLYFSISATTNASVAINNFAGLWAIDIEDTHALRLTNSLSYGTYSGTVPTICGMGDRVPTGDGIYAFWIDGSGNTGGDYTTSSPYTNFEARIDTDIIPVGGFLTKNTFSNIEFKLAKPLVSGEAVRLSQRSNLTDGFVVIGTTTTAGLLSDNYTMNFENVQWLQIRAEVSSTATNPSYVPLVSITFRQ